MSATPSEQHVATRPSLGHLILWVSCCAAFFPLSRTSFEQLRGGPADLLLLSVLAMLYGACWAGSLTVIFRYVRAARPRVVPGEWLLFCLGFILAADSMLAKLPDDFIIRRQALELAIICAVLVVPTLSRRLPIRWKLFFAVFVLSYAVPMCIALLEAIGIRMETSRTLNLMGQARPYIVLIALAAVVLADARERQSYGWSHWLGVGCTVIWTAVWIVMDIA